MKNRFQPSVEQLESKNLPSAMTYGGVASTICNSPESLHNPETVLQLYQNFLGRQGSTSEVAYWQARVDAGESVGAVKDDFANSAEYAQRWNSDEPTMIAQLYPAALLRQATNAEATYWVNLAGGVWPLSNNDQLVTSPSTVPDLTPPPSVTNLTEIGTIGVIPVLPVTGFDPGPTENGNAIWQDTLTIGNTTIQLTNGDLIHRLMVADFAANGLSSELTSVQLS